MTHEELLLLGERLRTRRNELGFTQEYMAEEAGISLRFYQMVERGEKSVSLSTLIRLSQIMSISIDYLVFGNLAALKNPITDALEGLTQQQREDALAILRLYSKGCRG